MDFSSLLGSGGGGAGASSSASSPIIFGQQLTATDPKIILAGIAAGVAVFALALIVIIKK